MGRAQQRCNTHEPFLTKKNLFPSQLEMAMAIEVENGGKANPKFIAPI